MFAAMLLAAGAERVEETFTPAVPVLPERFIMVGEFQHNIGSDDLGLGNKNATIDPADVLASVDADQAASRVASAETRNMTMRVNVSFDFKEQRMRTDQYSIDTVTGVQTTFMTQFRRYDIEALYLMPHHIKDYYHPAVGRNMSFPATCVVVPLTGKMIRPDFSKRFRFNGTQEMKDPSGQLVKAERWVFTMTEQVAVKDELGVRTGKRKRVPHAYTLFLNTVTSQPIRLSSSSQGVMDILSFQPDTAYPASAFKSEINPGISCKSGAPKISKFHGFKFAPVKKKKRRAKEHSSASVQNW